MTITIELTDQQVSTLRERAEAEGFTLETWLQRLAVEQAERTTGAAGLFRQAVAEIRQLRRTVRPDPEGWTIRDYINCGRR